MKTICPVPLILLLLAAPAAVQAQDAYSTNPEGSANIVAYAGPPWIVTIPTNINGLTVTTIGDGAFEETALTSVTIPNSVTSIGEDAFFYRASLTNLNTTGVSLASGGATYADSLDFTLDTRGIRPITLTGSLKLAGGAFQLSFSNAKGASFSVFGVTNPAVPFSNWMFLGTVTDSPPGQFQFTDPQGSNYPQRFYRVNSP